MSKADKEYWILEFEDDKYMIFNSKKSCKKHAKKVKGSTKIRQIIGVQALQKYQRDAYTDVKINRRISQSCFCFCVNVLNILSQCSFDRS